MRDLDDLDADLSRHLGAMAHHIDVGDGDLDTVPHRAARQRRRRAARRGGAALAGVALLASVFVMAGGNEDSPVDTIDDSQLDTDPRPDAERRGDEARPVEVVPFENTSPMVIAPVAALGASYGIEASAGATGSQVEALVRSDDGINWQPIPDIPVDDFTGITGRDDLLALAFNRTDAVEIATFDGDGWVSSAVPAPTGAQYKALASSASHLLVLVEVPTVGELEWRARRAEAEAALEERFGPYDSFSTGTSPEEGTTYHLYREGEPVFEGTAEEAGIDPGLLETLFEGPPERGAGQLLLYTSEDGATWNQGDAPTEVDSVDPARVVASDSDVGMTVGIAGGFAFSADGESWTTVAVDGVTAEDRVDVQHGTGYVVAATMRTVARADTLAGPYETVTTVDDPSMFLTTAVAERGVVIVETTIHDSPDGIDSAAEAESLGLDEDAYAGPDIDHRVLVSPNAHTFEPLALDSAPGRFLFPHATAPDGWIVVREQENSPESFRLGNGYRIDPGG